MHLLVNRKDSKHFNKQLIETLRKTIRFCEPYGVFIDDTVKKYKLHKRDCKSMNNIDIDSLRLSLLRDVFIKNKLKSYFRLFYYNSFSVY